ncbi:class I SAM-dependent methyltransferase [Brachyspira hyodysenteriae]|nr:class I SAM-dependent methyltransferase [Brachyspira hyodysenteriae]
MCNKQTIVDKYNSDIKKTGGNYLYNNGSASEFITKKKNMDTMLSMYNFEGKNILEIGCGDGTFSLDFAKRNPTTNILATEPSEEAISAAKKLQNDLGINNIAFDVQNVYDMKINSKFDCIVIISVLHHLPDPEKAISIASNYSDNLLIIENNGYAPALKILEKISKYHREHDEKSFTLNRLRLWIKNAGMEIKNYKYIDIVPMFCPNWFAHLLNFIAPIFEKTPVLKRLSCARVVIFSSKN